MWLGGTSGVHFSKRVLQKYSKIEEEDNIESAVSKLAVEVPDLAKADIRRVLTLYAAAKMASE